MNNLKVFFVDSKDNVEMNSTEIFKEIFLTDENNTKIRWNLINLKFRLAHLLKFSN